MRPLCSFAAILPLAIGQDVLFDFILCGTEVDEQSVFDAGSLQVAEYLGDVFVGDGFAGFEFDDENSFNE